MSLFNDEMEGDLQCDGKPNGKCRGMRRVNTLLRYHHRLMSSNVVNPGSIFTNFCDSAYSPVMATNDYIHFIQKHSDNVSRRQLVKELDLKCGAIGHCVGSLRHYGRRESEREEVSYHSILEQFDALHFNVFHIEEGGFRVVTEDKDSDEKVDDDVDLQTALEIAVERSRAMEKQFDSERWNGGANSKYTISVQSAVALKQKGIFHEPKL